MNTTLLARRKPPALVWCCLAVFALAAAAAPARAQRLTLSELQAQIDALEARTAALEQQGAEQAEALADLQAQIGALTVELQALEQQGADQGEAIADVQAAVEAVEAVLFPPPCGGKCVFVTSTTHDAGFGGIAAGDQICNDLASDAGLPGTYRAWLSFDDPIFEEDVNPNGRFVKTILPYRLPDGSTVADNYADLVDGSLQHPIDRDETGAQVGAPFLVWTATEADGTTNGGHCDEWTTNDELRAGDAGDSSTSDSGWTASTFEACSRPLRLYCFQQ